jgi:4-hydroxy-4-methyl-2-oxoglutarate aldolase
MTHTQTIRHVVVTNVERAPLDIVDQLAEIGTATVHEALQRRGYVGAHIRPIQTDVRIAGTAITVLNHPGDNGMVHAAVEQCGPGDVLVVASTAPSTHGLFGDLLATSLMTRGVRGIVTDAAVRDTADLRAMGFPAWSQHVSCRGTVKGSPGSVNVPVVIGEQVVYPGDVVCADDDGVVIVARSEARWVLEQAKTRIDSERTTRTRLEQGELMLDFYGIRDTLVAMGVEWIDAI